MRTHSQIVAAAGRAEEIAIRRGVSVHTVRSWAQRDSIPGEHWAGFAEDGHATLEELAVAAAAKKMPDLARAS
jgi:uncharacterized protein YjcR